MAEIQHLGAVAPGLAVPERPTKDEAPAGCAARGFRDQETTDRGDCAQTDAERKRIATLAARAALLGMALEVMRDGACLLVGEAGRSCSLPSLQAAESLVYGCEQVRAEVGALAARLTRREGGVHA